MTLTGGYDAVLQLSESALARVANRMHQAGVLTHRLLRLENGEQIDLSFGAPRVALDWPPHADGRVRVRATTRVLAWGRPIADSRSAGRFAVADVVTRGRLGDASASGATLTRTDQINVDWTETAAADVTVYTNAAGFDLVVRSTLLSLAQGPAAVVAPVGYLADAGVTRCDLAVVSASGGDRALAIGLDMFGTAGSLAACDHFVQHDWASALSRDYALAEVRKALVASLGALPPPDGPAPVSLDDRIVCTLSTPFGCAETARQRTLLMSLMVDLAPGAIRLSGEVRQETDSWHVPALSATWSLDVTLSVDPAGLIRATAHPPATQLQGVATLLANALTGGAIEGAVRKAITDTFRAGFGDRDLTTLLDVLLGQIARLSTTADAGLAPGVTGVEVGTNGLVVHGLIACSLPAPAPAPAFRASPVMGAPGELSLFAGESWTPGDDPEHVLWDFGDGAQAVSAGQDVALVARHVYAPGTFRPCLTVIDAHGRSSTVCAWVAPGTLALALVSADAGALLWHECVHADAKTVDVTVAVTTMNSVVPGATVVIQGAGWQLQQVTGANGRATFALDVATVRQHSATSGGQAPGFAIGGADVVASSTGYLQAVQRLWLLDCDGLDEAILNSRKLRDRMLERLAGYKVLESLRAGGPYPGRLPLPAGPQPAVPPHALPGLPGIPRQRDAMSAAAARLGAAADALTRITQLVDHGAAISAAHLLGVEGDKQVVSRLESLWKELDASARSLDRAYAPLAPGGADGERTLPEDPGRLR